MEPFGFIASFAMGMTLGLMGAGGAILTVPILVYLFQVPPSIATGYSLFVVGLTALFGSILAIRRGEINFKLGFAFAIPSTIGVNISRGLILPNLPSEVLTIHSFVVTKEILIMTAFAIIMILASRSMLKTRPAAGPSPVSSRPNFLIIAAQGLFVGLVAGFVGAGGGFLIIPALVILAGLSMRVAVGTSLTIIAVQSLLGFTSDVMRGTEVHWSLLLTIAGIAILGLLFGSSLAHKVKEQKLKVLFGWFVLAMGSIILLEQFRGLFI